MRFTSTAVGFAAVLAACSFSSERPDVSPGVCGDGAVDTGEQCDDGNGVDSDGCTTDCRLSPFSYFKASNTGADHWFGHAIALSADGNTLAVGAPLETSVATGINGDATSTAAASAGAVYVFVRSASLWTQQAYVKASNTDAQDEFGFSVALSADGNTLAVGARFESSAATGIDGNQASNAASGSGAAYVFARSDGTWRQQAYVKPANNVYPDLFGQQVALSADGSVLAVGAPGDPGVQGDPTSATMHGSGAVYVFTRSGESWQSQAYLKASNLSRFAHLGSSVALSSDGATLAAGAYDKPTIDGDPTVATFGAGAAYVFARSGAAWTEQAYVQASNSDAYDHFGASVALSGDGDALAVGALNEASAAIGIDGDQSDNSAYGAGAVYLYRRRGATWSQQAYVKGSNAVGGFGTSTALSEDGATLAVGAAGDWSASTGFFGDPADRSALAAGAAYVFVRLGDSWEQLAYVKAPNAESFDGFGTSIALSAGGTSLAVGAAGEASAAVGVGGDQSDDSAQSAGAAYVANLIPLIARVPPE